MKPAALRSMVGDLMDGSALVLDEEALITIKDKGLPYDIVLSVVRGAAIVTIGCHVMSLAGWSKSYRRIGEANHWHSRQIEVLGQYIYGMREVVIIRGLKLRASTQSTLLDACYEVLPFLHGAEREKLQRAMSGVGSDEKAEAEEPVVGQETYPWRYVPGTGRVRE